MPLLSRFTTFVMLLGALLPAPEAGAQEASGWTQGHSSRVRLIAGGGSPEALLAGIQIELDAGFKTYWRSPGEAGLPPAFDWSRSVNVEGVEVGRSRKLVVLQKDEASYVTFSFEDLMDMQMVRRYAIGL